MQNLGELKAKIIIGRDYLKALDIIEAWKEAELFSNTSDSTVKDIFSNVGINNIDSLNSKTRIGILQTISQDCLYLDNDDLNQTLNDFGIDTATLSMRMMSLRDAIGKGEKPKNYLIELQNAIRGELKRLGIRSKEDLELLDEEREVASKKVDRMLDEDIAPLQEELHKLKSELAQMPEKEKQETTKVLEWKKQIAKLMMAECREVQDKLQEQLLEYERTHSKDAIKAQEQKPPVLVYPSQVSYQIYPSRPSYANANMPRTSKQTINKRIDSRILEPISNRTPFDISVSLEGQEIALAQCEKISERYEGAIERLSRRNL